MRVGRRSAALLAGLSLPREAPGAAAPSAGTHRPHGLPAAALSSSLRGSPLTKKATVHWTEVNSEGVSSPAILSASRHTQVSDRSL